MKIVESQKFFVVNGSKTHKAILSYKEKAELAANEWESFAEKYGASKIYAGDSLMGLVFDGRPPEGWVRADKRVNSAFRPSLKRPLTEAAKEYNQLKSKPNMFEWLDMLGLGVVSNNGSVKAPGFKFEDGQYHLTAQEGCPIPDDVVPA